MVSGERSEEEIPEVSVPEATGMGSYEGSRKPKLLDFSCSRKCLGGSERSICRREEWEWRRLLRPC